MQKFFKGYSIWALLWFLLALALGIMVGYGLSERTYTAISSPARHKEETKVILEFKHASSLCKKETELASEPSQVADRLYGEELYRFYISQIHEQHYPNVDPYIALAVLEIESNYQPDVISSAGAIGLMQWIPKWHAWRMEKFHLNDMWDPYTNIIVGMDLLNDLYFSTGSWREALYGYNHSTVYVNAVLSRADSLRGDGYFG